MVLGHGGAGSVKGNTGLDLVVLGQNGAHMPKTPTFFFSAYRLFFSSNFSGLVFWATCEKLLPAFSIPFNGPHRAVSLWSEE